MSDALDGLFLYHPALGCFIAVCYFAGMVFVCAAAWGSEGAIVAGATVNLVNLPLWAQLAHESRSKPL